MRLTALLLFLLSTAAGLCTTIQGDIRDITGATGLNTAVKFTPLSFPLSDGTAVVAGPPRTIIPKSGKFTNTFESGNYTVTVGSYSWTIAVPASGTYDLADLGTNGISTYTYTNSGPHSRIAPGSGVTVSTNTDNAYTIYSITASGSGTVSNAAALTSGYLVVGQGNGAVAAATNVSQAIHFSLLQVDEAQIQSNSVSMSMGGNSISDVDDLSANTVAGDISGADDGSGNAPLFEGDVLTPSQVTNTVSTLVADALGDAVTVTETSTNTTFNVTNAAYFPYGVSGGNYEVDLTKFASATLQDVTVTNQGTYAATTSFPDGAAQFAITKTSKGDPTAAMICGGSLDVRLDMDKDDSAQFNIYSTTNTTPVFSVDESGQIVTTSTGYQIRFGATNTVPSDTNNPVWIYVKVGTTSYRLAAYPE